MPAGFGSRLREKIESTRSNSSSSGGGTAGLGASKNIRGLTRLSGTPAPPNSGSSTRSGADANVTSTEQQGGLLSRKPVSDAPNSPDKSATAKSAASSSAEMNPPSAGTTPTAMSTALGGSKIVPGWGAATSGHLGGIKSKNNSAKSASTAEQQHQSPTAGAAAGKNVPWAMHQPPASAQSSPLSNSVNYQSSQKPRWGDEEDDSDDDEFPQIGSKPPQTNSSTAAAAAANSLHQQQQYRGTAEESMTGGGGGYNNYGGGGRYSDQNHRDYQQSRRSYNDRYSNDRHENDHYNYHRDNNHHPQRGSYYDRNNNHRDDYSRDDRGFRDYSGPRGGGGGFDNRSSHNRDDYNDNRRSSSSSFYNDRRFYNDDQSPTQSSRNDSRWGFAQRAPSHFSDRRSSEDYHRHRSGSGHEGGFDNSGSHHDYRSSRRGGGFEGERGAGGYNDREGGDRYGFGSSGRREDGHRGGEDGRVRSSSIASSNQDHRAEDALKQQLGIDTNERINRSAPETPMLLLRNNNNNLSAVGQGTTQPSGEVSRENDDDTNSTKLGGNVVGINRVWAPTPPVEPTPLSLDQAQSSVQQTMTKPPIQMSQRSPEEEAQYKKDQAIEQQQSILRQVAERRAARVSRTESEISADESNNEPAAKWERGQKLSSARSGDETQILEKRTNPCRKKGHDHDWADCPDNRSSDAYVEKTEKVERENPCRKPGHDHDWKHCPDNRQSEEYAAKMEEKKEKKMEKEKRKEEKQQQQVEKPRPCRIEGHDHDWRECPKNPKSENFIRDNPCEIEGHDHDWVDCPDNPKSENYKPPKRKSKKAPKKTSKKDTHEDNESDVEEKADDENEKTKPRSRKHEDVARKRREESRNLAKEDEDVQSKDKPLQPEPAEVIEEDKPKGFVPAPPPKVPAWSSGPPASIKKTSLASSEQTNDAVTVSVSTHVGEAPIVPSPAPAVAQQHKVPDQHAESIPQPPPVAHRDRSASNPAQHVPQSGSMPNQSTMQSQPILPPSNALFPGNSALFGESQGSSVYGSWNPPPMVLPSTYVDPWKPNPFAPTSSTTTSIGAALGGIWSGSAVKPSNTPVEAINTSRKDPEGINKVSADQADNPKLLSEVTKQTESNGESKTESIEAAHVLESSKKSKKPLRKPRPEGKGGAGKGKPGKEGKPNPCRKPGHDHDWSACPDNRKSESFAGVSHEKSKGGKDFERNELREPASTESLPNTNASAPTLGVDRRVVAEKSKKKDNGSSKCRIEGHDHLWKDCPNNTKAKGKGSKLGFKKKPKGKTVKGESQPDAAEASS